MLNELNMKLMEIYTQLLETKKNIDELTLYNQELINIVNRLKLENSSLKKGVENRQNYIDELSKEIKKLKGLKKEVEDEKIS